MSETRATDDIGAFPTALDTWGNLEPMVVNFGGIPYPHQLAGICLLWNTGPNIADTDRFVLSWTRPPESARSGPIGVDSTLGEVANTRGEVTSVPATAEGADGAPADVNLGWWKASLV